MVAQNFPASWVASAALEVLPQKAPRKRRKDEKVEASEVCLGRCSQWLVDLAPMRFQDVKLARSRVSCNASDP